MYSDIIAFHKLYRQAHQHLPKPFRFTAGEQILAELAKCLRGVAVANYAHKDHASARIQAVQELGNLFLSLEVIRALLTAAWELRFISHHVMAQLGGELDTLGKQATRWGQWFERGTMQEQ